MRTSAASTASATDLLAAGAGLPAPAEPAGELSGSPAARVSHRVAHQDNRPDRRERAQDRGEITSELLDRGRMTYNSPLVLHRDPPATWCSPAAALRFVGRIDDVIKASGESVSLTEVEVALAPGPGVLEAAVVGEPDQIRDVVETLLTALHDTGGAARTHSRPASQRDRCDACGSHSTLTPHRPLRRRRAATTRPKPHRRADFGRYVKRDPRDSAAEPNPHDRIVTT